MKQQLLGHVIDSLFWLNSFLTINKLDYAEKNKHFVVGVSQIAE